MECADGFGEKDPVLDWGTMDQRRGRENEVDAAIPLAEQSHFLSWWVDGREPRGAKPVGDAGLGGFGTHSFSDGGRRVDGSQSGDGLDVKAAWLMCFFDV